MTNREHVRLPQWALLPLRLVVGTGFLVHGFAKLNSGPKGFAMLLDQIGVPLPIASAWIVTLVEIVGGAAILLGMLVALASVPLIATMLVAMMFVHLPNGFSSLKTVGLTPDGPVYGPPGYEINLLYIAALIVLAVAGGGPLSADRLLRQERAKRRTDGERPIPAIPHRRPASRPH